MTPIQILLSCPQPTPISRPWALARFAEEKGLGWQEWEQIARDELAIHPSGSLDAFKYQFSGIAIMVSMALAIAASLAGIIPLFEAPQVFLTVGLFAVGAFIARNGRMTRIHAAVAAAVLRHKAQGLSDAQIHALKEHPNLRDCTSTRLLLQSVRDGAR